MLKLRKSWLSTNVEAQKIMAVNQPLPNVPRHIGFLNKAGY